jgi:hypothetical protein
MAQPIVSDRKQGPSIAQGRGPCDKCGAGLHVLGEEFSAFVASIGGDPAATRVAEGLELGGGYVLTVAEPGGGYHCPKCGHPGVFTPLKLQ